MKLVYADLFSPFTLECDRVNLISIEQGTLCYKLMNEFSAQCTGATANLFCLKIILF